MALFSQIKALLSLKNAWLPPIFFVVPRALAKFCFLRSFKPRKNIPVSLCPVGTTHRKPEYIQMRRTYAQ